MSRVLGRVALAGAMLWVAVAFASAQQQTTTTETKKFEVIAVDGNNLVVKLPEGTRELTVPEDFRFNVDGQQMSVHELKPGMKGTATITTKTTLHPVTVTEVKNGEVMQVTGSTILVRTDQGFRNFTQGDVDKRGVKIYRGGQPAQLSDFHTGDRLTATIVTTKPPRVVTEKQVNATLARAAPAAATPAEPAAAAPSRPAASTSPQPTATAGAAHAPRKLPKTASPVPLIGFAGFISLALGLVLTSRRRLLVR
jgi:LPXTG-motif cell wall-anchored protein